VLDVGCWMLSPGMEKKVAEEEFDVKRWYKRLQKLSFEIMLHRSVHSLPIID
jgi:hypothetical protein